MSSFLLPVPLLPQPRDRERQQRQRAPLPLDRVDHLLDQRLVLEAEAELRCRLDQRAAQALA